MRRQATSVLAIVSAAASSASTRSRRTLLATRNARTNSPRKAVSKSGAGVLTARGSLTGGVRLSWSCSFPRNPSANATKASQSGRFRQPSGQRLAHLMRTTRLSTTVRSTETRSMALQGTNTRTRACSLPSSSALGAASWARLRAALSAAPGKARRATFKTTVSTTERTSDTTSQCTNARFAQPRSYLGSPGGGSCSAFISRRLDGGGRLKAEFLDGELAHPELLHLACDGHRKLIDELHIAGHLEMRHVLPAVGLY